MIPYTTIPFISALFLMLVGVLIGQLFWSNFRTKHQRTIVNLRRQMRQQRQELRNREKQFNTLSHESSAAAQLVTEQACELEQLRYERCLLESTEQELTDRLKRETQTRKDMAICLEDERQRHEEASRQSALLRQRVSQDGEAQAELQRKLSFAEKSLADQLQTFSDERRQLAEQIEAMHVEQAGLQTLVAERQQDRDAADRWQSEADRLTRAFELQTAEVHRVTDLTRSLRQELECAAADHKQLEESRRVLASAEQTLSAQLDHERAKRKQLESMSDRLKTQLVDARREIDRLAIVEDRSVEFESQYRQAIDELKRLRHEREDSLQAEATTRQIVAELRDELNERLDEVEVLRRDKEVTANQLGFERRQRKQIEEALELAESRTAALQSEKDGWGERQSKLIAQTTELTEQVRKWQTQAHELELRGQRADRQVAELARQLDNQQQLADKMRRRRFHAKDPEMTTEGRGSFSFRDMRVREPEGQDEGREVLAVESELRQVTDQATRRPDDLKKIPGIADRVEEQLHRLGVFTYRQVMEWDRKMIAEISRRLDLGDLIEQHDWVTHARRLHHENERHIA
jgi:predicted flap endonuclease-1-like 5' DNA nuclease